MRSTQRRGHRHRRVVVAHAVGSATGKAHRGRRRLHGHHSRRGHFCCLRARAVSLPVANTRGKEELGPTGSPMDVHGIRAASGTHSVTCQDGATPPSMVTSNSCLAATNPSSRSALRFIRSTSIRSRTFSAVYLKRCTHPGQARGCQALRQRLREVAIHALSQLLLEHLAIALLLQRVLGLCRCQARCRFLRELTSQPKARARVG